MSVIYVGNLDVHTTVNDLHKELDRYGKINDVWIARNPPGFAFVEYADARDAKDAVREMDGRLVLQNKVRVELSRRVSARGGDRREGGERDRDRRDRRSRDRGDERRGRDDYRRGARDNDRRGGRDTDYGGNGRDRDNERRGDRCFDRDRDRDRDRGRERSRDRDFGWDRDRGRERSRDRDFGWDRDRERDRSRDRDFGWDRDRGRDRSRDRDFGRDRDPPKFDFLSDEYNGVNDLSDAIPRTELVAKLLAMVYERSLRFVHIAAPAASGKTTLLQLSQQHFQKRGVTCIYVSALLEDFVAVLRQRTGINANTWTLEGDDNGHSVCGDKTKSFVVMLDDAQHRYHNTGLWASLIKTDFERKLPNNIGFIISATYSLTTHESPVDFGTLPKLVGKDFRLSHQETDEYIRRFSAKNSAGRAGRLLMDPAVHNLLTHRCNGHIGALSVSVHEIVKHFLHIPTVTVEDVVSFYLSKEMASLFLRCYASKVRTVPEEMRRYLAQCVTAGPLHVPYDEGSGTYNCLVRAGVLEETKDGRVKFTSPAAAAYVNDLIFPRRGMVDVDIIREGGVFALMKSVIKHMSGTALRQSVVDALADCPSATTFQHLVLAGLEAAVPASCLICPELSKHFPLRQGQEAELPAVTGRCDYYLNDDLQWVIEVLISGDGVGEQLARLEGEGKYVGLAYSDYVVVDFRVNATGEPTNMRRHPRRMTAFFKRGDFSFCTVLCGLSEQAERIDLST